ncbi:unnamed protein product [Lactuca saligna]|uniref:Uncharacterized protein n=1 Tax=Lactuca saligna TaxID=75948 RepID=A0AA36E4V3_LACSI|nr:unnamed protein product [Lactuca saligna]
MKSIALGSTHSSRICRGHWVTRLTLSYEVDTSGIVPMPIWEMGIIALGKEWVLVRGVGQQWRIPEDDIVESIQQVESEDIPKPTFMRRQRRKYMKPDQPELTLRDVIQCLVAAQE